MIYFDAFILVAAACIFAKGITQSERHKREWHQARFHESPMTDKQMQEYKAACAAYDDLMKKEK